MSTQKVIQNVTKTDNSFTTKEGKLMFQYQITFQGDPQVYDAYSPNFKFNTGDSVEVEANPSDKMPNKVKITAVGSTPGNYNKNGQYKAPAKNNYRQDDPNKDKFIIDNIISTAATENILSESKLSSDNVAKYTHAVLSEINPYLKDGMQDRINIGAALKRASKLPECKDATPSTLVDLTIKDMNNMYIRVTGKPYVQNQAHPELEESFLDTLK